MELSENTAGELNDTASLIWFVPEDSTDKTTKLLEPLAKKYIAKWNEEKVDPEMLFYVSGPGDNDDIRDSLRSFAKLKMDDVVLAIIDIPEQKVCLNNYCHKPQSFAGYKFCQAHICKFWWDVVKVAISSCKEVSHTAIPYFFSFRYMKLRTVRLQRRM